ncbi:hypothetical protein MOV61_09330 [Neorhizobium sp. BETTINA12A]|uniref:hypothetical protein n=1 Tax=unclassified Neorhizobium TaxID=2629175 RepID=UPI001FF3900E|nr:MULTISPECIES: hypothetical protein [unclassified Neorhizobium]MCJ9670258.1 hypothetical protein [Neorhizobium sp. SHOUNA12B]MCJ9746156.1 hypothetical protein [Neorhizobium sp. SHOUNA12A]MCJ9750917.1 hypothetical protein [Neorhizobium sp. BETTINA12A]
MASNSKSDLFVIHVKLTDEPVPVWRPVEATKNPDGSYLITPQTIPDFEEWEFLPGDSVAVEERNNEQGRYFIATRLRDKI